VGMTTRPKRKLRTAAQRTASRYVEEDQELGEPNVRLSRAFIVVLLLHVVAVAGIFAFSALKDRQQTENRVAATAAMSKAPEAGAQSSFLAPVAKSSSGTSPVPGKTHRVKPGESLASIASQFGLTVHDLEQSNNLRAATAAPVGRDLVIPSQSSMKPVPLDVQKLIDSSRTAQKAGAPQSSGADEARTYIVQRGDSPAGIAKRFKVSYTELLKTNNIADPKKLQIGQKLSIPVDK
jgi:LysM repeat protein